MAWQKILRTSFGTKYEYYFAVFIMLSAREGRQARTPSGIIMILRAVGGIRRPCMYLGVSMDILTAAAPCM